MGLDIRWPIGLMFSLIGVAMTAYGVFKPKTSVVIVNGDTINIDLIWGVVLLIFGVLMLLGAVTGRKNPPAA